MAPNKEKKVQERKSRRGQSGFTLAELMIVLAIIGTIGALGVAGCTSLLSGDAVKEDGERSARQYASEMNIKVDGVSCGNRTNQKGQVYCSINSGGKVIPLSCIGKYKVGRGCVPRMVTATDAESTP